MTYSIISSLEELEGHYGEPVPASQVKVSSVLTDHYKALIAASPFCTLATVGPEGLDCSPRGDAPENGMDGMVRIIDPSTLMIPDRRGNNRIDSLRNIVRDPRVALLFLIPGSGTTLRVNGTAQLSADQHLLEGFAVNGQAPRMVIIVSIQEVYFQCSRAVKRADLWNVEKHPDLKQLPTPGMILAERSQGEVDQAAYDSEWQHRAAKTMW